MLKNLKLFFNNKINFYFKKIVKNNIWEEVINYQLYLEEINCFSTVKTSTNEVIINKQIVTEKSISKFICEAWIEVKNWSIISDKTGACYKLKELKKATGINWKTDHLIILAKKIEDEWFQI